MARLRMNIFVLLLLLSVVAAYTRGTNTTSQSDDDYHYDKYYDADKNDPTRSDDSCKSWVGTLLSPFIPCLDHDSSDSDDIVFGSEPALTDNEEQHIMNITLYVSLPPRFQSVGHYVKTTVTWYLNNESIEGKNVDLNLTSYGSKIDSRQEDRFWWQYRLKYACFWSNTAVPIDAATKEAIRDEFLGAAMSLRDRVSSKITEEAIGLNLDGVFQIQLEKPTSVCHPPFCAKEESNTTIVAPSDSDSRDGVGGEQPSSDPTSTPFPLDQSPRSPTMVPESASAPDTLPDQLDTYEWDWQRSMGLCILLVTMTGTVCLAQVAGFRRRRRDRKELWGNLATEEGVNELLRTGWKVNGTKMEVYDKKDIGYRDDDSVLIGGFEQKEHIGAEITVTHSETTPDISCESLYKICASAYLKQPT